MKNNILLLLKNRGVSWSFLSGFLPLGLSYVRASAGKYFNGSGVMQNAASDFARFSYDPASLDFLGVICEPQRTNLIKNSALAGASVPSSWPDNWVTIASQGGISRSVAGVGTEYGMSYVDIRFAGTSTNTTNSIQFVASTGETSAVLGQTHCMSFYARLVGGSLENVSRVGFAYREYNDTTALGSGVNYVAIDLNAGLERFWTNKVISETDVTQLRWGINILANTGTTIDVTIRYYQPQQEIGATVTSPIITSGASVTRAADQISFSIPSGIDFLRFVFDDYSTQDVVVSAGEYTVPTNLDRTHIKSLRSL